MKMSEFYVKPPGWSDFVEVKLNMIPGQIYNVDPNDHFVNPCSVIRDPLALYPLWEMVFYFNQSVGGAVGIAVGVWGDTKEIAYITEYGYLGVPNIISNSTTQPELSEAPSTPDNNGDGASTSNAHLIGAAIVAVIAVIAAVAAVALKKRNK